MGSLHMAPLVAGVVVIAALYLVFFGLALSAGGDNPSHSPIYSALEALALVAVVLIVVVAIYGAGHGIFRLGAWILGAIPLCRPF